MLSFLASPGACRSRPVHLIALSQSFLVDLGPQGAGPPARPVLVVTEICELVFSTGEADLKAHWGVLALHACVFGLSQGVLEPPRISD